MNLQVAEQVVIFLPSVVESLIEWHKEETLGALAQPFCEYQVPYLPQLSTRFMQFT